MRRGCADISGITSCPVWQVQVAHAQAQTAADADAYRLQQAAAAQAAVAPPAPAEPAPPPAAPAPSGGDDLIARLTHLASLHSAGVLTDEEFAAAKAKLLG